MLPLSARAQYRMRPLSGRASVPSAPIIQPGSVNYSGCATVPAVTIFTYLRGESPSLPTGERGHRLYPPAGGVTVSTFPQEESPVYLPVRGVTVYLPARGVTCLPVCKRSHCLPSRKRSHLSTCLREESPSLPACKRSHRFYPPARVCLLYYHPWSPKLHAGDRPTPRVIADRQLESSLTQLG